MASSNAAAHSSNLRRIDRSTLKIIALIAMTVGHFFLYTLKEIRCFGVSKPFARIMCYVAYIAPPTFFFFIAEGFRYTHSRRKYAVRLLIFAVLTQLAAHLHPDTGFDVRGFFGIGNVFFVLLFGFLGLWILHSGLKLPVKLLAVGALLALSQFMNCEWEITGVLIILAFYYCKGKPWLNLGIFALLILFDFTFINGAWPFQIPHFTMLFFLMLAAVLVLFCYNGEKGRSSTFSKYFFYVFYPLHLLLINLVKALLA